MANGNQSNLPAGFVLDQAQLPEGFVIDAPEDQELDAQPSAGLTGEEVEQAQQKRVSELPELKGILSGEDSLKALTVAPALLTATNDKEFADILTSNFPNIGISETPEGQQIAVNNETGQTVQINEPGLSKIDVLRGLGFASLFTPAGGFAGTSIGALTKLAGGAAATQAGIETAQAAAGGEFDPEEVALAGVAAPVGQVVGEKVLSPVARAVGGKASEAAREAVRVAKEKGVKLLTSDVLPPESFLGKSIQQLGEKLGPIGTGSIRAAQQKQRQEVVENIAQEFGVELDSPLETSIVKSLEKGIAKRLNKAAAIRNEAVESLDTFGDVPVDKTLSAIDEQIAKQQRLRADVDPQIVERLSKLKKSIQNADFSLVKDLRSNLIDDISAAFKGESLPTKAGAPLQAVKSAIDKDLLSFAKANDRDAAAKWIQSNRLFADSLRKAKDTELKRLLTKGTDTPESVATILKGGKLSELNRLDRFIGEKGRQSAKASIIRDALTESGFFTGNVNPDRFVTALNKPARQKAIGVFFKGNTKKEIDGVTRLLDATRRAQQASVSTPTGQQIVPLVAGAGAVADPVTTFLTAGSLAAVTRGYESKGVRSLLLRLANTPKGSVAEKKILDQVLPAFQGAIQSARAQIDTSE